MLNNVWLTCFVHFSPIAFSKKFRIAVCGLYRVVSHTTAVPSSDVFCVASFADVFEDLFDCLFVVGRTLLVLRCH